MFRPNLLSSVKTLGSFLTLVALVFGLPAQTPPATNTAPMVPKRMNRAEGTNTPLPAGQGNIAETAGAAPAQAIPALPPRISALNQSNIQARMSNLAARPLPAAPSFRAATNPAAPRPTPATLPRNFPVPGARPAGGPPAAPGGAAGAAAAPENPLPNMPAPTSITSSVGTNGNAQAEDKFPPGLIKLNDADVNQVLELYQLFTGRTVMRGPTLPNTKITIQSQTELTRKEAIQALDSILSLNGIAMIPQGEKFVKAVPQGEAGTAAARFNEVKRADLPESGSLVAQVVRLTNALPRDVAQALVPFAKLPNSVLGIDSAGILILRDYAENVKRMMEVLEQIDVVPQQEFESIVIPIKYALASDIAQVLGSLTAGGGGGMTTVGKQQTRTGLTSGTGSGGMGGMGGAGGMGGYGANQNQMNMQGNNNAMGGGGLNSGAAGRSSFADRLRQIVNKAASGGGDIVILGTTKIIADERTNSLLIFASKQDLATISNIIDKLDVVLPQVLIEAIIMEVSLGDELKYGVSYLQTKPSTAGSFAGIGGINNGSMLGLNNFVGGISNGVSSLAPGFSYAAKFGDFEATATAAANDSRINVLSRPRIQTSHAVEANLFVGRTRPYVTGTYGGYGGYSSSQYQQMQIGITLSVLPLINPDGLVVMDIRQRIQSLGKEILIDGNSVPETIDREANAKVSVRDRETVMLGGFISDERSTSKSGVPILKDIPILGHLFSNNSKKNDRSELIVLIRPTVLPNPADAAVTAMEEKQKLPGISTAEREFQKEERSRQKKAAKDLKKSEGL